MRKVVDALLKVALAMVVATVASRISLGNVHGGLVAMAKELEAFWDLGVHAQGSRPNILLIVADDLGYGDLPIYGNAYVETPNLEGLAENGARLDQFYTAPVCAPTRASLMTGRHFLRTGVWGVWGSRSYMSLDETTIAEALGEAGYETALFGKWHLGEQNAYLPHNRGFEHAWVLQNMHQHTNPPIHYNGGSPRIYTGWTDQILTDLTLAFMREERDRPFFAYVAYPTPHEPWEAPVELVRKYQEKGLGASLATIFAMVEFLDQNVGRLLNGLDELGIADNTIVVFMSDNGPIHTASNMPALKPAEQRLRNPEGRRGNKGSVYDNGTRVPGMIRWPGVIAPQVVDELIQVADLFPTLLDLAGIPEPRSNHPLDGTSLAGVLKGEAETVGERLLFNASGHVTWPGQDEAKAGADRRIAVLPDPSRLPFHMQDLSVRNERYKFVTANGGALFDMEADPRESRDVRFNRGPIAAELQEALREWFDKLIESGRAYTNRTFLIGYPEERVSPVPTHGPIGIEGFVRNRGWASGNWRAVGDAMTIRVEVVTPGSYGVYLDVTNAKPGVMMSVAVGDRAVEGRLSGSNGRVFLGEVDLPEGAYDLTVRLIDANGEVGELIHRLNVIEFEQRGIVR